MSKKCSTLHNAPFAVGEPSFGIAAPFAVGLALLVSVQAAGKFTGEELPSAGVLCTLLLCTVAFVISVKLSTSSTKECRLDEMLLISIQLAFRW